MESMEGTRIRVIERAENVRAFWGVRGFFVFFFKKKEQEIAMVPRPKSQEVSVLKSSYI